MKIECVVVSVGYSDFLSVSLPLNKHQFDQIVVATSPEDVETQKLCEVHHVKCVVTDSIGTDRGEFRKGAGINAGLRELDCDGWIVHLDADVVLPTLFRRLVEGKNPDPRFVYGCDRYMIPDAAAWYEHTRRPKLQHENDVYLHTDAYPIGTRIVTSTYGGYVPIGFFQMWNPTCSGVWTYPDTHTDAGRTDMLHSGLWSSDRRTLLGEVVVYHLQSDPDAKQGANWEGRTTPEFAPHPRGRLKRCWWRWRRRRRKKHHHHHRPEPPPPYPRPDVES